MSLTTRVYSIAVHDFMLVMILKGLMNALSFLLFSTSSLQDPNAPLMMHGSILGLVEKLDDEFTKILQATDAHSTEYVDKWV